MTTGKTYTTEFKDKSYPNLFKVRMYLTEEYDGLRNVSVVKLTKMESCCGHRNGTFYWNGYLNIGGLRVWTGSSTFHSYGYSTGSWAPEEHGDYPYVSGEIAHEADGTKSVAVEAVVYGTSSTGFSYSCSTGRTIALTEIPRASGVSAPMGVMGQALHITVTKAAPHFTHSLCYAFGEASGSIAENTGETAIVWIPPMELCAQIPNAPSGKCTITCTTYNGEVQVGLSQCVVTLQVPDTVAPKVSPGWATVLPDNAGAVAGISCFVQGYSRAQVQFDSSKIDLSETYGAAVTGFTVVCGTDTLTQAPYKSSVQQAAGDMQVQCTLTDSRGSSVTETLSFAVEPYTKPVLSEISVYRSDSGGNASNAGLYIGVHAAAAVSSLAGENTRLLQVRYKPGGGDFEAYETVESGVVTAVGDGTISITGSYVAQLLLTDRLGNTASYTQVIPTEAVFFSGKPGGTAAGFGKHPERDGVLELAWDLLVQGSLTVGGKNLLDWICPVGIVVQLTDPLNPTELWGGTWRLLQSGVTMGSEMVNVWKREE